MAVNRLATSIFDFYPDSPNYGLQTASGMKQESLSRAATRNNEAAIKEAEIRAKISELQMAAQVNQMNTASSNRLFSDVAGAFAAPALAGMSNMNFGGTESTIGLGDGFNIGQGQAGLDTGVDLDRYLQSGGFITT